MIPGSSENIEREVLKSTFGALFESVSSSLLLLLLCTSVIVESGFCIRTPFVLIGPGCSGTNYDPDYVT